MKLNLFMLKITNINDKRGQKIAGKVDHVVVNGVLPSVAYYINAFFSQQWPFKQFTEILAVIEFNSSLCWLFWIRKIRSILTMDIAQTLSRNITKEA